MRRASMMIVGIVLFFAVDVATADEKRKATSHGIGRAMSDVELKRWDISVFPNGVGLPEGRGTVEEGEVIYQQQCAGCHGDKGEGRPEFPSLVGGRGTLASPSPVLTVGSYWPHATSVFDYIRRAMPYATPGSLTNEQVYAVTAWILHANDIIGSKEELNQQNLSTLVMPNRDGFVKDPRPDVSSKR